MSPCQWCSLDRRFYVGAFNYDITGRTGAVNEGGKQLLESLLAYG